MTDTSTTKYRDISSSITLYCVGDERNLRTGHLWSDADRGKTTYSGKKPVLLPLWAQHIVHGRSRDLIPGPISVGFAVDQVLLCQYHPVHVPHASRISTGRHKDNTDSRNCCLRLTPVSIISPMIHTHVTCRRQTEGYY